MGTLIGLVCVVALLLAAIFIAVIDRKEKAKGNLEKSKFLSRLALGLFLASFVGGVVVTLVGGIKPREEKRSAGPLMGERGMGETMGSPMGMGTAGIGKVDPKEIERLQKKVAASSKEVKSRERLGHLYLQQQNYEGVFQMAHEALQADPHSVESRAHMGMVLFAMQDFDQALAQLDRALEVNPNHLESLLFKGIVQFQGKNDLAGAQETWGRFMKLARPSDDGYERVKMFLKMIDGNL